MQTASITRAFRSAAVAGAVLAMCAPGPRGDVAARQAEGPGGASAPLWRAAPGYAELFAPAVHRQAYRFFTSSRSLAALLAAVSREPASVRSPGSWTARPLLPFEAFGQSGAYDRARLARLYGARRAQVARGPRQQGGTVVESWTMISPYPDPALTRLEAGTLLIVLRLP